MSGPVLGIDHKVIFEADTFALEKLIFWEKTYKQT